VAESTATRRLDARRIRRVIAEGRRKGAESLPKSVARVAGSYKKQLVAMSVLSVVIGLTESTMLLWIAQVALALSRNENEVSVGFGREGGMEMLVGQALLVLAGLVLIRLMAQFVATWITAKTITSLARGLRKGVISEYLNANWNLKSQQRSGRLQEIVSNYIGRVVTTVLAVSQILRSSITFLTMGASAVAISPVIALGTAVTLVGLAALLRPLRLMSKAMARRSAKHSMEFAQETAAIAATTQDIQVFGIEDRILARAEKRIRALESAGYRARLGRGLVPNIFQAASALFVIAGLAILHFFVEGELGALSAIILIFLRSSAYIQQLQSAYQRVHEASPYLELLAQTRDELAAAAIDRSGAPLSRVDRIEFAEVAYSYQEGPPALRDVSFAIERGETIGIVGPSGAGKSTLVQLLLRLRSPDEGVYLVNGLPAGSFSYDDWTRRFAFVPQEPHLLGGSVSQNIAFFRPWVDQPAVEQAACRAHIDKEIRAMTSGYDTWVGDDGRRLSGGQRQRVSIARALAGGADVVVLDEPTSALDMRSESLIQETIGELKGSATVIIIAHRLSTLSACDRIMVISEGRLQAFASASTLVETNGFYREAVQLSRLPQ
jgi:ATP-binding cassette, subfamily B, bacterial